MYNEETAVFKKESITRKIIFTILSVLYVVVMAGLLAISMYGAVDMLTHSNLFSGIAYFLFAGWILSEIITFLLEDNAQITEKYRRKE